MRAGNLRHRVVIQRPVEERNDLGEVVHRSWAEVATVWSDVHPLDGRERWLEASVRPELTHAVRLRYRGDVTSECRLLHDGRVLRIDSVVNIEERNRELRLRCVEELGATP